MTRTAPPLSIVIPSYRRADYLQLCLQSLQLYAPPGTEIIVVDDASAGSLISLTASQFPGVQVIRLPKQGGFCRAANTGIRRAQAPIVELLNDDTEVTAGWAEAALRWFANPRVAAVAPLVLQYDERTIRTPALARIDTAGDDYDAGGFARKRGHGVPWAEAPKELRQAGPVWGTSAAAGFYRRSALIDLGGFPDPFGAYFEDVDVANRLRAAGHETWYDPEAVVWHRVSSSHGRKPGRKLLIQQSRNEEWLFWRNQNHHKSLRHYSRHVCVLAAKGCRRLAEGTFTPWLTGRCIAWANLRVMRTIECGRKW